MRVLVFVVFCNLKVIFGTHKGFDLAQARFFPLSPDHTDGQEADTAATCLYVGLHKNAVSKECKL